LEKKINEKKEKKCKKKRKKRKVSEKIQKKRNALWIAVVIHSALCVGEQ
jgi:hypothetical protein